MSLGCYRCARPYSLGPDLVIPTEVWERIAPKPGGGGVLCPNCIHDRLVEEGFDIGTVPASFTSGPMAHEDSAVEILIRERAMRAETTIDRILEIARERDDGELFAAVYVTGEKPTEQDIARAREIAAELGLT